MPAFDAARIVIVDDQQANVTLLEGLLEQWGYRNLLTTTDSSQALELCTDRDPDLLLLDLQMPAPDGYDVMRALAERTGEDTFLPILVLTADVSDKAMERALELGATDFLRKPVNFSEVRLRVASLLERRRLHLALRVHNEALERRVSERTRSLEQARLEVLERLSLAAEYRDDNTNEHAQRVGRTAALLARVLQVPEDEVELIHRAAPLHDIGKIGIPDAILLKPKRLTRAEYTLMQSHVEIGAKILGGSSSPLLQLGQQIAETHHERWNGEGYPAGLAGEEIPLAGRLVALADMFDAITHHRPYREAATIDLALAEIRAMKGTHLEPRVVEAFETLDKEALLARIEPGSNLL